VQSWHHENVGVLEVRTRRGVELVKFVLVGESHLDDLWAHTAHEIGPDRPARGPAGYTPARTSTVISWSPASR